MSQTLPSFGIVPEEQLQHILEVTNHNCKITDIKSRKTLAIGKIISHKLNYPCISTDYKHYWKLLPNQKYTITTFDLDDDSIPEGYSKVFTENIPDDYIIDDWCELKDGKIGNLDADIYIEKDIKDIDPEIEPLVTALNKLKGVRTTTSCCGHGEGPGYVAFEVIELSSLSHLSGVLYNIFPDKWELVTNHHTYTSLNSPFFHVCIKTLSTGPEAYKDIVDLANYLDAHLS